MRPEQALNYKGIPKQFIWKGLDGSSVIVSRGSYGGFMYAHYTNKDFISQWDQIKEEFVAEELEERMTLLPTDIIFLNYGNDDCRPLFNLFDEPIKIFEFIDEWNNREKTEIKFSTPKEYFAILSTQELPVYEGTIEQCELTYNTPVCGDASMWRIRMQLDRLIVKAEVLCSFASILGIVPYPYAKIKGLWLNLFEVTGHAIEAVLEQDREFLYSIALGALSEVKALIHETLEYIAVEVAPEDDCYQYVLLNTLNWPRNEIVVLHITTPFGVSGFDLFDNKGNNIEYQITEIYTGDKPYQGCEYNAVDIAVKLDLPSMGYMTLKAVNSSQNLASKADTHYIDSVEDKYIRNSEDQIILNNGCIELTLDRGIIKHIKNLGNGSIIGSAEKTRAINCLRFVVTKESKTWISNWETEKEFFFIPESWMLTHNGPLQWVYCVEGSVGEHHAVQYMTLNKGEYAIEFSIEIDSIGGEGYLIVGFPSDVNTSLHVDIPFGVEERDLSKEVLNSVDEGIDDINFFEQGWRGQFYGKTWAAFSSGGQPCTIVSHNCSIYYNHDTALNTVALLLNRQVPLDTKGDDRLVRWIKQTHPSFEGKGLHHFNYSLYFNKSNDVFDDIIRFSKEKAHPVEVVTKFNKWSHKHGDLCKSLVDMDAPNVIISAFYKEGQSYILRMYEACGEKSEFILKTCFYFDNASCVDLLGEYLPEQPLVLAHQKRCIKVSIEPWQILSIRFLVKNNV